MTLWKGYEMLLKGWDDESTFAGAWRGFEYRSNDLGLFGVFDEQGTMRSHWSSLAGALEDVVRADESLELCPVSPALGRAIARGHVPVGQWISDVGGTGAAMLDEVDFNGCGAMACEAREGVWCIQFRPSASFCFAMDSDLHEVIEDITRRCVKGSMGEVDLEVRSFPGVVEVWMDCGELTVGGSVKEIAEQVVFDEWQELLDVEIPVWRRGKSVVERELAEAALQRFGGGGHVIAVRSAAILRGDVEIARLSDVALDRSEHGCHVVGSSGSAKAPWVVLGVGESQGAACADVVRRWYVAAICGLQPREGAAEVLEGVGMPKWITDEKELTSRSRWCTRELVGRLGSDPLLEQGVLSISDDDVATLGWESVAKSRDGGRE